MGMPYKFAFELDHHDIVAIERRDDVRRPVFGKQAEFAGYIDCGHAQLPYAAVNIEVETFRRS